MGGEEDQGAIKEAEGGKEGEEGSMTDERREHSLRSGGRRGHRSNIGRKGVRPRAGGEERE